MRQLSFRYRYDSSFFDKHLAPDDFGRLSMAVVTDHYSGKGSFWAQWQDLREFGDLLDTFPIRPESPLRAQWGYDMQEGDDLILSVEIAPTNKRGDLTVRVEIADEDDRSLRVRAAFQTNYPDLLAFRAQIAKLMDNEIEEAVLIGR